MRPKFMPVLEQFIENGALLGYRRACKHNDNSTEQEIVSKVYAAIMEEIYEWFEIEETMKNEWS
jgi:hypothetical protein